MRELRGRASKSLQVGKPPGEIPLEPSPQGEVTVIQIQGSVWGGWIPGMNAAWEEARRQESLGSAWVYG